MGAQARNDALILERAARILRRRGRQTFAIRVIIRVLERIAAGLRDESGDLP